ncbi:MAG: NUDIX hydrolase [Candidatus Uhrbacteria bacterium]|nr:NUDIX hydrolase [Candidatus Uhrbacteria bacterium]
MNERQSTIVKGVVKNRPSTHILLLHNTRGYWDLPGGKVEFGETPEEALRRECREEAGVNVTPVRLCSTQTIILDGTGFEARHYLVLVYECRMEQEGQTFQFLDASIDDAEWVAIQEVTREGQRRILSILPIQVFSASSHDPIRTAKKIHLRSGEVTPYREVSYE